MLAQAPIVQNELHHDVSRPLRELALNPPTMPSGIREADELEILALTPGFKNMGKASLWPLAILAIKLNNRLQQQTRTGNPVCQNPADQRQLRPEYRNPRLYDPESHTTADHIGIPFFSGGMWH